MIGSPAPAGSPRRGRSPRRRCTVAQPRGSPATNGQARHSDGSAPRRTWLAAERTYLAWLRTGLGAIGVSLAVGRLLPALIGGPRLPFVVLGAGYGVLGAFIIVYAIVRTRNVDVALRADGPIEPDWWAIVTITAATLALAVATIVIVLAEL